MAVVIALAPGGAFAEDYWQCVPFARLVSGIQIFGDAWTWWSQAAGKYQTGFAAIQCMYAPEFNSHSESLWIEAK